jgi:aminopeptidase N
VAVNKLDELELEKETLDRASYYRQQEALIKDMVESGNTQLMALHYEITEAKKVLGDLKIEIRTARQDKRLIEADLQSLQVQAIEYSESLTVIAIAA